ncbi:hypothetical protein CBL_01150 [Carabus blaptoides fortunei]
MVSSFCCNINQPGSGIVLKGILVAVVLLQYTYQYSISRLELGNPSLESPFESLVLLKALAVYMYIVLASEDPRLQEHLQWHKSMSQFCFEEFRSHHTYLLLLEIIRLLRNQTVREANRFDSEV